MINGFGQNRPGDIRGNHPVEANAGIVLDFSKGKRLHLNNQVQSILYDLLDYGNKYFDNWRESARARFVSYSQGVDINRPFEFLFQMWYVSNYRFHNDVSPIVDFYMAECEEILDEAAYDILAALKHSFLSIYEVMWARNNTVVLRDIFCDTEVMTFSDLAFSDNEAAGSLWLARVITVDALSLLAGKPVSVARDCKRYLFDEVNSTRIYEGEVDFKVFLREYGEVTVGLVMDLSQGIKKSRIKYRCMALTGTDSRKLVEQIVSNHLFSLLDRKDKWLKFTWNCGTGKFSRLYLGSNKVIAATEDKDDLIRVTRKLNPLIGAGIREGAWVEGYKLDFDEDAEDLLIEIMHDKYIEEWLTTPSIDLENMTPLVAMKDIRGRVLLENLLNDLEIMELRASSRGEYALPTSEIRTKLGLDKNTMKREMLNPEAIAIKVNKYRSRQDLSAYVTGYNWVNEECEKVADYLFDLYYTCGGDKNRLAWLLYIWNEFSAVYRPKVTKVNVWAAALEHSARNGGAVPGGPPIQLEVSAAAITRNSSLITAHLKRFPLLDNLKPVVYPLWPDLDNRKMAEVYNDVLQRLQVFAYTVKKNHPQIEEEATTDFFEGIDTAGFFWDEPTSYNWQQFFKLYYLLSYKDVNHFTIANCFWENQAKRYPPHLHTAAFNLMMSFIGAYSVTPAASGVLIFEDLFSGCQKEVYGRIGRHVHKSIVPGTIVITRLLPLDELFWIDHPFYTLSPDLQSSFEANLHVLMEQVPTFDTSDPEYLKKRGLFILKAYLMTLAQLEYDAVNLLQQPLEIEWRIADQLDHQASCHLLTQNSRFQPLYSSSCRNSYIWISPGSTQGYDWGYVLVENNQLLLCSPPGKDEKKFRKEIRRSFKMADIVVACRELKDSAKVLSVLKEKLVHDLAGFFSRYPQAMPLLFRPDELQYKEEEWLQGVFLYKLGLLIMKQIESEGQ